MNAVEPRRDDRDQPSDRCPTALAVACPICVALPGEPCMPMGLTAPHFARVELAREARR